MGTITTRVKMSLASPAVPGEILDLLRPSTQTRAVPSSIIRRDIIPTMITNHVREKAIAGNPTIGAFLGLGSPTVAGLMANAGFDWLVIETEHNGLDSAEVEHMLMAMAGTNVVPIVRIPSANHVYIQRALDMGAMGILVPMVRSTDEAQSIVSATRYPPQGTRSWGPLRASRYTFDNDDYLERANDNILVALIIETREAIDELDSIAAVPGVDVLMLGTWDMSLAMGLDPRELPLSQLDDMLERLLKVGNKTGVSIGSGGATPELVQKLQDIGVTFISYGPDYALLANAATAGLTAFQRKAQHRHELQ